MCVRESAASLSSLLALKSQPLIAALARPGRKTVRECLSYSISIECCEQSRVRANVSRRETVLTCGWRDETYRDPRLVLSVSLLSGARTAGPAAPSNSCATAGWCVAADRLIDRASVGAVVPSSQSARMCTARTSELDGQAERVSLPSSSEYRDASLPKTAAASGATSTARCPSAPTRRAVCGTHGDSRVR